MMSRPFPACFAVFLLIASFAPGITAAAETSRPKLLIIAPEAFVSALDEFVRHKQQTLPTRVEALENVLQTGAGADAPEKLKRHLYDKWRTEAFGYVLLVGDVDRMPVRYMVLDRITPAAFDYAFYPSDLYYSDLAGPDGSFNDWNRRKESFHGGYFGEVRGERNKEEPINFDEVDYLPDIAVGRWPVSTPEELARVAAKTIRYEKAVRAGEGAGLRNAALFGVDGWVDTRALMHRLADKLSARWQVHRRLYGNLPGRPRTPPPGHEQLIALFNEGLGLALHTGHGQPGSWEKCFSIRDMDRMTNTAVLPVIMSAGCSTASFAPLAPYDAYVDVNGKEHAGTDNKEVFTEPPPPPAPIQTGRFNPTGLGEQVLKRNDRGGVAYIGCNTGSQPCALTLLEGFVDAVARPGERRLGDCWTNAIRHYVSAERLATLKPSDGWYPPSIFFQGMKFMLFGDPSLPLP